MIALMLQFILSVCLIRSYNTNHQQIQQNKLTVSRKIISNTTVFNSDNNKKWFWSTESVGYIIIISEGSCDIEDRNKDCKEFSFAITVLKYIKIEKLF